MFHAEDYSFANDENEFMQCFKEYCEWCFGHGYGDCDVCRKSRDKYAAENYGGTMPERNNA